MSPTTVVIDRFTAGAGANSRMDVRLQGCVLKARDHWMQLAVAGSGAAAGHLYRRSPVMAAFLLMPEMPMGVPVVKDMA
jgi:hypothetical protein